MIYINRFLKGPLEALQQAVVWLIPYKQKKYIRIHYTTTIIIRILIGEVMLNFNSRI